MGGSHRGVCVHSEDKDIATPHFEWIGHLGKEVVPIWSRNIGLVFIGDNDKNLLLGA